VCRLEPHVLGTVLEQSEEVGATVVEIHQKIGLQVKAIFAFIKKRENNNKFQHATFCVK
jgi:hypothetical protein